MVCMINQTALKMDMNNGNYPLNGTMSKQNNSQTCDNIYAEDDDNSTSGVFDRKEGDFTWSKSTQGLILGSFFWGYMTTQILGGWLSARFGGKRIFGWCMFVCALITILVPVASNVSPVFLIVLRTLIGCCQGVVWPTMHAMWAYWSPPLERSKLIGFTFAGSHFGTVLTFPVAGFLCDYGFAGGWPSIFYIIGSLGIVWFIAWMFLAYDTPEHHPRITEEEKLYIQESLTGQTKTVVDRKSKIPWLAVVKSPAVWAIIVTHISAGWIVFSFLTNIPTYMREVLKFDIAQNGLVSSIPYIGMWIMTILSGIVADALRERKILSTTVVRKLSNTIGLIIPAIICIILGYLDCTQWLLATVLLSTAVSLLGITYAAGFVVNFADIAPQYASVLFGISNTAACIPGFVAPFVIGILTTNQTKEEWRVVFFLTAAISSFGAVLYLLIGSGEQQTWAALPVQANNKVEVQMTPLQESTESDNNDNAKKEEMFLCNDDLIKNF